MVGWGFHGVLDDSIVFSLPPRCSSRLPGILGAEVDDAQDDSRKASFVKQLYLASKPSHVGLSVYGLAYCHTQFLCQNQELIICMTKDKLFHTYDQKGSQKTKCHE
jgi:hypothetical protein